MNKQTREKSTGSVLDSVSIISRIIRQLLPCLALLAVFCMLAGIRASPSDSDSSEDEAKELERDIRAEIRSIRLFFRSKDGMTEKIYKKSILEKSNPELAHLSEENYLLQIYRQKEYLDLDVSKYTMKDIGYGLRIGFGVRSLRILDSSPDKAHRKQRNRVFVKLLYSLQKLRFNSLVIENIRIGANEFELLQDFRHQFCSFEACRLVFRNVSTKTIQVVFKRLGNIYVERLCIEDCDEVSLDRIIVRTRMYVIQELELTDVGRLTNAYKIFLRRIRQIRHLKLHRVLRMPEQLCERLLCMLKGTLEISWAVYKQLPLVDWVDCTGQITQLHLLDVGLTDSIEEELRDTAPAFPCITVLNLSLQHTEPISTSMLQSVILYTRKYYGNVGSVIVLGRMQMENVQDTIRDKSSGLRKTLLAHASTHFTFANSTEIEAGKKYLLFISFSMYNRIPSTELGSKLGVLRGMSNWDWDKQGKPKESCGICNAEKKGYMTQLKNEQTCCNHQIIFSMQRQQLYSYHFEGSNVQLRCKDGIWYPRRIIFLQQALEGHVYLAETQEIPENVKSYRTKQQTRMQNAGGIKRPAIMHSVQDSTVGTSMASTSTDGQEKESLTAAKQLRYDPAVSDINTAGHAIEHAIEHVTEHVTEHAIEHTTEQPVVPEMDEEMLLDIMEILGQPAMAEGQHGYSSYHWLCNLIDEAIMTEAQETQRQQNIETYQDSSVLLHGDPQMYQDTAAEESEEHIWTQM